MEGRPADTDLETEQIWLAYLRSRSPADRLMDTLRLCEQSRLLAKVGIATRHPDYDEQLVELALRRWHWGDSLFGEVYPDGPMIDP
ncbi:MAG: hypothetical protein U0931_42300 [Vulcanimicrobiota bacterium]